MACCQSAYYYPFPSPSQHRYFSISSGITNTMFSKRSGHAIFRSSVTSSSSRASYKTFASEAVRFLGPPARFEASKLKVVLMEEELKRHSGIILRTYVLSHCDFTANLTLTISNVINLDQLREWCSRDDVVVEWKKVDGQLGLHIHCHVSGPNLMLDLPAEFRYHIFSKEMPLVLEAVLHGDSVIFQEHPELMDSLVWVFFHSGSKKYNRLECWGPLKDSIQGRQRDQFQSYAAAGSNDVSLPSRKWKGPKSLFQALFAFLL